MHTLFPLALNELHICIKNKGMELKYSNQVSDDAKTFDVYMFGKLGDNLDGDYFARELVYLDREADQINLHINSPGGNVMQGMSIVSVIMSMTTPVTACIDGVAASMAAVIAVACEKVVMYDYARMMIHDPYYTAGGTLTKKQKNQVDQISGMLRKILSRRGQDESKVESLMAAETWMSASEAMGHGLCDQIATSARGPMVNMSPDEILNHINNEYKPKPKDTMKFSKKTNDLLGISAEATEVDIEAAITKIHSEKETAEKNATEATKRAETAEARLKEIDEAAKTAQKAEASELVEAAIKEGRLDASAKESTLALFEKDHQSAKTMLASIPKRETVAGKLGGKAGAGADILEATWDELDKSGRLEELKAKYPDAYADKFAARFNK